MVHRQTAAVLLTIVAGLGLHACSRQTAPAADAAPRALTLDERALPPMLRFSIDDLDTSLDPCRDFVGDFWATGMDEARIEAQGLMPLQSRLAEIEGLTDAASIAEYLRRSAARGEGQIFGFGPEADFQDPSKQIAYAVQGGLSLPDRGYYFDKDKQDTLAAYQMHVARVLELAGATAEAGSLDAHLWSFVDGTTLQNEHATLGALPAATDVSKAMSKDMKKRGFRFVGPTTMYALMQAMGMVNDHTVDCYRWKQLGGGRKRRR